MQQKEMSKAILIELKKDMLEIFKEHGHARTPIEASHVWECRKGLNKPMYIKIVKPIRPILEDIYRKLLEGKV